MMIWNEMEIVNVARFRQPDIMGFAEAVEESRHIYDNRCNIGALPVATYRPLTAYSRTPTAPTRPMHRQYTAQVETRVRFRDPTPLALA